MLNLLIPTAYAQASQVTGAATGAAAGGAAGVQSLIGFVFSNIDNWIAGLIVVIVSYMAGKMLAGTAKEAIIKSKGEDVHEASLVLVDRITIITMLVIGLTIAFAINGLNFTAVIGALSLGFGFAMKDILSNFISGVIMLAQNRINIGDFIKIGEILGTIVSIDARATVLQSIDGTEVVIPNQQMLNEKLISYSTNPFRRIELIVGVDYGTDLPMVTSMIKGIIDADAEIVPKPEPLVLVDEFGDSSINIKVFFWIESNKNWQTIRSNLANRIKKSFDKVGVGIPFPIRTLKLDEDDRSFLKTMDSMKKGLVPEPATVPSDEEILAAAKASGQEPLIPHDLVEHPPAAAHVEHNLPPNQPTPQAVKTETAPAPQEQQPKIVVEEPTQAKTEEGPTPPPTHI